MNLDAELSKILREHYNRTQEKSEDWQELYWVRRDFKIAKKNGESYGGIQTGLFTDLKFLRKNED